jgi:hypothetical protein
MGLSFHTAEQSNASAWEFNAEQYQHFAFVASEKGPLRCNTKWEDDHWHEIVKKKDKDAADDDTKRKFIAIATSSRDQGRQVKKLKEVGSNVGAEREVSQLILDTLHMKYMVTYDSEDSPSDE